MEFNPPSGSKQRRRTKWAKNDNPAFFHVNVNESPTSEDNWLNILTACKYVRQRLSSHTLIRMSYYVIVYYGTKSMSNELTDRLSSHISHLYSRIDASFVKVENVYIRLSLLLCWGLEGIPQSFEALQFSTCIWCEHVKNTSPCMLAITPPFSLSLSLPIPLLSSPPLPVTPAFPQVTKRKKADRQDARNVAFLVSRSGRKSGFLFFF